MAFDRQITIFTIACEASNQSHVVRQGVAASILNRVKDGRFGKTASAVCLKRFQYSEWLADAADNANLERVAGMTDTDPVILDCGLAYDQAVSGTDPTDGATHFFADSIAPPDWADKATFTVKLGNVLFYKDVP
jgi:N-acetylmuramoyl-L-alanine amidase